MTSVRAVFISACFFLLLSCGLNAQPKFAPGVVLVKFRNVQHLPPQSSGSLQSGLLDVDAVFQRYGAVQSRALFPEGNADRLLRKDLGLDRVYVVRLETSVDIDSVVSSLSALPEIEYAEPDYSGRGAGVAGSDSVVPGDTFFFRQWAFRNTGSNLSSGSGKAGADITATLAWAICKGDTNIIVADLDSGLKRDHPDIANRVWINKKEIPGNGIDDDGNGYVDDVYGWNFAYNNNSVMDDYGHGTNTASIIAAQSNNGLGYAGLDWACKIMPLKELDSTDFGYYSWWASSLYYAANNGARVINMSEGGTSSSSVLRAAIDYAYARGCFIAAAMMNDNDSTMYYPASYSDHVVAVGATDAFDNRCNPFFWGGGSNYGSWIDVVAPGNIIYGLNNKSNTDYGWYWGGTSQATPMVCGLASLLLAQDSTRSPATIRTIIRESADDTVGPRLEDAIGRDNYYGYGRINCYKALLRGANGVEDQQSLPLGWILEQNYPNPFNPSTVITFRLPVRSLVVLKVYDLLGRELRTLIEGWRNAGTSSVTFDASGLPSGIYFYRIEAGSFRSARKLVLLR